MMKVSKIDKKATLSRSSAVSVGMIIDKMNELIEAVNNFKATKTTRGTNGKGKIQKGQDTVGGSDTKA